ncbi:Na+/H+ antiporter subunit E [Chloroflexus sp. MS-CIW-1]|jgi:multicomponent Na+:H+ antiporter subunit E|uniref:Na+/H+ antiporter subunit E n=1 Tax=Chloroflexus sp. MS-CIW-1 TaxID=3055768 RepID=UPI002648463A|nr:Na+/H+ antiporter subunit E [Chloroflexus sp. MS-CIW-1]MDN5270902.1 Na+/H+ antiporter subunit E [Chloroflexus sp. MS-CIW-1]
MIALILLILVLTMTWMALQSSFTLADLIVGLLVSSAIVAMARNFLSIPFVNTDLHPQQRDRTFIRLALKWVAFIGFALWSILKANIDMARIVLFRRVDDIRPGIIAIPLDVKSDAGITVLANLITLTPGTVSLDVATDRRTIYIHCIDVHDADAIRNDIKQQFERRVMELLP